MDEIAGFDTEANDLLLMDDFDSCIAGVVERFGQAPIVCYDRDKVIEKLMADSEMSGEEAEEYFQFNQIGAWHGELTPCFITMQDIKPCTT